MKSKILHVSTECFPAAKAGGMGDVLGSLPIYLKDFKFDNAVVIPRYKLDWFENKKFESVYKIKFSLGEEQITAEVLRLKTRGLKYKLYCIDIPGKFDRSSIYLAENGHGYWDEIQRNLSFQLAVLYWQASAEDRADLLHCHDHMTGLIPFFTQYGNAFEVLKSIPTVFTIHNGHYWGAYNWSNAYMFPEYDQSVNGLLDWDGEINPLATAVKCAWAVTTVSPNYMEEIKANNGSLSLLFQSESGKSSGVINGVDYESWNPQTDEFLDIKMDTTLAKFKSGNKKAFIKDHGLKSQRALIGFIGRFAYQKGADMLVDALRMLCEKGEKFAFFILGSGDQSLENQVRVLADQFPDQVACSIAYDEALARRVYASSDFLVMPSRFEPCGLNQLFAMRYGTVPVVSAVGGLIDTVPDINDDGNGIVVKDLNAVALSNALERALGLYKNKKTFNKLRKKINGLDYSWSQSAQKYADLYNQFLKS